MGGVRYPQKTGLFSLDDGSSCAVALRNASSVASEGPRVWDGGVQGAGSTAGGSAGRRGWGRTLLQVGDVAGGEGDADAVHGRRLLLDARLARRRLLHSRHLCQARRKQRDQLEAAA